MKRREFLGILGGAAAVLPVAALAVEPGKVPTVGFLGATSRSIARPWVSAFEQRLNELRWTVGSTVAIEYRWAEGRDNRYTEFASEFSRLKVDVIITQGTPPVLAAMQATSVIPIVFVAAGDPVGSGLVKSLARPGGNVTGVSNQSRDLVGERIELLREAVPNLRRIAILANIGNPSATVEMSDATNAALSLGYDVIPLGVRRTEDIAPALEALNARADALYVSIDTLVNSNRALINASALNEGLPTMLGTRDMLEGGGLMSYGPNLSLIYHRAAEYVDKILRGTKPGDIPVEQPTRFDLVINLKVAKTLGLAVSPTLLAQADEVIE